MLGVLLRLEWFLAGCLPALLVLDYPQSMGMPFELPHPVPMFPTYGMLAAYYSLALLCGAAACLFRERFMAVLSRAFFVFAVIALAETARDLPGVLDSFLVHISLSRVTMAIGLTIVLLAALGTLLVRTKSNARSVHRALLAAVVSVFALYPLALLFDSLNWPMFHSWALAHGQAEPAVAIMAAATYLALGLVPGLGRAARPG